MKGNPSPLRILELRAQIAELSGTIRALQRSGLDDCRAASPDLEERAELEEASRALEM